MVKLVDLMGLERLLLEIDVKYKFNLPFNDAYHLYEYLKEVGKITSYLFLIQDEFNIKYEDEEKLKEYHDKLMNDSVEFDCNGVVEFINKITESYGDDNFKSLVANIKFW